METNHLVNKINELKNCIESDMVVLSENIPYGDMPGDKVQITETHIHKSKFILKHLLELLPDALQKEKIVISVCGGSGVGKSETASLLSYYFNKVGIKSYTLSGDNYPHRIPKYNDAERIQVYREGGIHGLLRAGLLNDENIQILQELQAQELDSSVDKVKEYKWLETYQLNGYDALLNYLGTEKEIGFEELSDIIKQFKNEEDKIYLRRMGRTQSELWYEPIEFSDIQILIIEWTHGNNKLLCGVDIPILLNSTPEETLAHRKSRNRDGKTDSCFTQVVLKIEQNLLHSQAANARFIISKDNKLLNFMQYCATMNE